jgi:DNA-binding PadR family transcriptional regulator
VRIYELSEDGKEFLLKKFQKKIKILDNKINAKFSGEPGGLFL